VQQNIIILKNASFEPFYI